MKVFGSVRSRLLLMVTVVVLAAVASVGWVSSRSTRAEFGQFMSRLETEVVTSDSESELGSLGIGLTVLGDSVEEHYRSAGGWTGVDRIFADSGAVLTDRIAMIVGDEGGVIAASDAGLLHAVVSPGADGRVEIRGWERDLDVEGAVNRVIAFRGPARAIRDLQGGTVGALHLIPMPDEETMRRLVDVPHREEFLGAVDRWTLGAVAVVGLFALAATMVLSGRIVGPIEQLTEASRRMGAGDLSYRVDVQASDEIGELARAFNSMAESLERNEHLRRGMVSDVAHELRTPLTNLRGQLEAVQDGLAQPTTDLIGSLHDETMLLSHLVDDLQDLALAEAGQLRLDIATVDVVEEIERAAGHLSVPGIEIAIDAPIPLVRADVQRFRQVLRNLLDNGIRHGGGDLIVAARVVDGAKTSGGPVDTPNASTVAGGGFVSITVADSGDGIEAEHLPNVFERFYRTDPSRQRATGGAGLGLAIVRQLVEAQGGDVWVESSVGEGTTFGFRLPVASSDLQTRNA